MVRYASKKTIIKAPSNRDLAYLAGLLDGEACFTLCERKGYFQYARIVVGMTNREVINWLGENFAGRIREDRTREKDGRKRCWYWQLTRQADLLYLLPLLFEYLIVKRDDACKLYDALTKHQSNATV